MKADLLPRIMILSRGERRVITCDKGLSLRDALDTTDLKVRSGCNGSGACGLCRVRIESGDAGEPRGNEPVVLTRDELRDNVRLACQVVPSGHLTVTILNPAPKSAWRRLRVDETSFERVPELIPGRNADDVAGDAYGVAVDLGTTNVSMSLWDMKNGVRLSAVVGPNRQSRYGSDVMSRLVSAESSPSRAIEMSRLAAESIEAGIFDMCGKDGYDYRKVHRISIVGNTAMLALLVRKNGHLLLRPDHWTAPIDCRPEGREKWFENGRLSDEISFDVVQPLGGFVGSDLLAGIVATGLTRRDAPALLIDFGTNSEIALWDGRRLWVTSAAGGPAFEGWGIRCGSPAEFGAIYRVDDSEGTGPSFHMVGGGAPAGICGSGIVDLVAHLVRTGKLSARGKLAVELQTSGFVIARGTPGVTLDNRDVDVFQRAKAAIGAGIGVLADLSSIGTKGLRRVCVCGSFGRFLNVTNAMALGLLPTVDAKMVEVWGSAALAGCEQLLLSPDALDYVESLTSAGTTLVNLSRVDQFEDYFLESLYLQPHVAGPNS